MLKIHTNDGRTDQIDLTDETQAKAWLSRHSNQQDQKAITGATLIQGGVQYSLSKPVGFGQIFYLPENIEVEGDETKGGERLTCFVDDIRLTLMVHRSQPSIRVSIHKTGKLRFNPQTR